MDPLEREDSSTYANNQPAQSRPVQEQSVEPLRQPAPAKKNGKAALILALLLVATLAVAGVLGWMWHDQSNRANVAEANMAKTRAELASLKADLNELPKAAESRVEETSNSDSVIEAALAFANAPVKPGKVQAQLGKQIGDFAYVNVATEGSGIYVILKKVNDIWTPILHGNGEQTQEMLDYYGVPADLIKS